MTYLETRYLYYNSRQYFRQHFIDSLPNDETEWSNGYRSWLREQGCELVRGPNEKELVVDVLGVAPGYDRFVFRNPKDATMFILRWS